MKPLAARLARLIAAGLVLCGASCLLAQQPGTYERQQRQYEEQLRQQMDRPAQTPEQRLGVDWGGWLNFAFADYNDSHNEGRVFRQYDLYLWGRATVDKAHEFYARGRFSFLDFNTGDSPFSRDDDWQGPEVDRLFYSFDLRRAALAKDKKNLPYNLFTTIGRQYVQFGTGLALSLPMDAVVVGAELANMEVKGLFGRTIHSMNNIDESPPVTSHSDRCFYGVQATYKGLKDHTPFVYYLWQQDHTDEHPDDPDQEYDYDSRYLGVGSTGRLGLRNLYYQTELVWEHGRSFGVGATAARDRDPICALAYDLMLTYLFQDRHKPQMTFEYLFASGDDDRRGSPTNTLGGNRAGTADHGFNGFGYRDTGLAFAPPISNLHMFRLGGQFRPAPEHRWLGNMALGADVFFFLKGEAPAIGPDFNSGRDSGYLGHETDIFCNWRITSDLMWTIRYGLFAPGSAYDSRRCRNFLFTGVSFSF